VSPAGLVTALSSGRAVITATVEGRSATAVVIVPPPAAALDIASGASVVRPGLALSPPLRVQARGLDGRAALTYAGAVTAAQVSGPAGGLIGTLTVNARGGVATFDDLGFATAGTYRLLFTSGTTTGVTSDAITVASMQFGSLVSTAQSATAQAADELRLDQTLELRDSQGLRTSYSGVVRASVERGTAVVVSGDSATAVNGVVRLPMLLVRHAGEFTVSYAAPGYLPYQRSLSPGRATGFVIPRLAFARDSVAAPGSLVRVDLTLPSVNVGSARYDVVWNASRLRLVSDSTPAGGGSVVVNRGQAVVGLLSASVASSNGIAGPAVLQMLTFEVLPGPADVHQLTVSTLEMRDPASRSLTQGTTVFVTMNFRSP
jgi:hypothetical protein